MLIMSFDPGGTTGVAMVDASNPHLFSGMQIEGERHNLKLMSLLSLYEPDIIICEDFDYRIHTTADGKPMPGIELVSRNYIGVIELYTQMANGRSGCIKTNLIMQKPFQVRSKGSFWYDPEKLKSLGVYKKSAPHQNDAMRHLLYWLTITEKYIEYLELLRSDQTLTLGTIST